MKIVDIDNLFKNYLKDFLDRNKGKYTDAQLEKKTEQLYTAFAETRFASLDGYTPSSFYEDKGDELVEILVEHFKRKVPVSDYLIDALVRLGDEEKLLRLVSDDTEEDLLLIVLEVLNAKGVKIADNRLIDLLFSEKVDDCVKDEVVETLKGNEQIAAALISRALDSKTAGGAVCEILSSLKSRDERITEILVEGFLSNPDKVPEYCSYFVDRFDDSVLPVLYGAVENAVDYVDYKELCLAIEALGGDAPMKKDFSNDKNYIKIKEAEKDEHKNSD